MTDNDYYRGYRDALRGVPPVPPMPRRSTAYGRNHETTLFGAHKAKCWVCEDDTRAEASRRAYESVVSALNLMKGIGVWQTDGSLKFYYPNVPPPPTPPPPA